MFSQTVKQTDRQIERHTDMQVNRHGLTDRLRNKKDTLINRLVDRQTDRQTYILTVRQTD